MNEENGTRYIYVFTGIAILGLLYPLMIVGGWGRIAWDGTFALLLVLVVRAVSRRRRKVQLIAASLAAIAIAGAIVGALVPETEGLVFSLLANVPAFLFLAFAAVVILGDVLGGTHVTIDKMFGAACVYIILGLVWAVLYQVLFALIGEGAFAIDEVHGGTPATVRDSLPVFLYFSFVSLTTLGYGEIVPAHAWTRLLSSVEAVVGQLYLTILVARLVGLHISQSGLERDRG